MAIFMTLFLAQYTVNIAIFGKVAEMATEKMHQISAKQNKFQGFLVNYGQKRFGAYFWPFFFVYLDKNRKRWPATELAGTTLKLFW